MAKLVRRRRRRRPRRPYEGEASGVGMAQSGPIKSALQAGRRAGLGLSANGKAQETEADKIADHALANGPKAAPMTPASAPTTPPVQAKLSPTATGGGTASAKGPAAGKPLSAKLKSRFSGPLGSGLGGVRIDTSAQAARETQSMGASAITTGQTISFAQGAYAPNTPQGAHLLAHELAHTVQQKQAGKARVQAKPAAKALIAKHGFPQVAGGLINDSTRRRMNVIVRKGDTLLSISAKLVRYWVASEADLSPEARANINPAIRTPEGMAKALLAYHKTYLIPPAMANWRAGLRLPLPMLVPKDGSPPLVNAPMAGLWIGSFKPAWSTALRKKASTATPQKALSKQDLAYMNSFPDGLGGLLADKALRNAKEALPLIRAELQKPGLSAGLLALGFLSTITNIQVSVLAGQPEGQEIIALLRAAIMGNQDALSMQNKASTARAKTMLGKTTAAFPAKTVAALRKAYKTQSGNHCMTACYMGIGKLYGAEASKNVDSEVRRKDKADKKHDLKSVVTMMETLQEMGRAGAPHIFVQKAVGKAFDKDPDAFMQAEVAKYKDQPGVYYYGLSAVTGYHTLMLGLDLTQPGKPQLMWLDQHPKRMKLNVYGALSDNLKSYAKSAMAHAKEKGKTYSPLRSKIWPLYPPSSLIMPLD